MQKQSPEVFYNKRCSQKFHKIHRKSPVPFTSEFCKIFMNTFFIEHLRWLLLIVKLNQGYYFGGI